MADTVRFSQLLQLAVREPGIIAAAYRQFHNYSLGNMLLASWQCHERQIPLGPIATYPRWTELGRHVKKGEKALSLCMPVTIKKQDKDTGDDDGCFTRFIYRNRWFVLAQTDGTELPPADLPDWQQDRALSVLDIQEIPFEHVDGNGLGYAVARTIAINPINPLPHKTRFHELAHVLLGHTAEAVTMQDGDRTPRDIRELEAEAVAMLVCDALGLDGAAESRGYIQSWYQGGEVPEKSAQKILKAADQILKAGRPAEIEVL